MHVHAIRTYISVGMLNHIQEQVSLMFQLIAQLQCQSLCHYTPSQLHNNTESSLHHHRYIRSCQTSLSMLLRLMPNCLHLCARLSTALQNKHFSLTQLLLYFSLETWEIRTEHRLIWYSEKCKFKLSLLSCSWNLGVRSSMGSSSENYRRKRTPASWFENPQSPRKQSCLSFVQ